MTTATETAPAYGFRVKETPTHFVDVVPCVNGWHVQTVRKASALQWGQVAPGVFAELEEAVAAALAWAGA